MCSEIKTLTGGGGDKHRSGAVEVVVGARAGVSIPQGPRSDDAADDDGDGTGYGDGSDGGWRTRPLPPAPSGWVACPVCPSVDVTCCRADRTGR